MRALLLGIFVASICAPGARAQRIDEREVTIPWALAGHNGLDALLVYAELPGKHPRTPMLWLYAENDKFFWPELAQKFDAAFRSQGGRDQFVLAPAVGDDGHALFRHVEDWSATVDEFLKAQNSVTMAEPLPEITPPNVAPPAGLSEKGLEAFKSYLLLGPHKAFATSQHSFGFSTARRTVDEAREKALENCKHATQDGAACAVVSVDNADVRQ